MVLVNPYDFVGVTFWGITSLLWMTSVFLFLERQSVSLNWRLPMSVALIVGLLYACQASTLRGLWAVENVPLVYRFFEWGLAVPLQLSLLYFVLSANGKAPCLLLGRLFLLPAFVLLLSFISETGLVDPMWAMVAVPAWGYLLFLLWFGEGEEAYQATVNVSSKRAYACLRWAVTVGWIIYPLCYLLAGNQLLSVGTVNIIFNLADIVNKVGFLIVVWYAAYQDSVSMSHQSCE